MNGGVEPSGYYNDYNVEANTISISEGGNSCGYVQFNTFPFWSGGHCYSIQNVARIMGIGFKPVGMKGIQKVVKWNYQCIGCKKWYKEKMPECPICGSPMKACRRK